MYVCEKFESLAQTLEGTGHLLLSHAHSARVALRQSALHAAAGDEDAERTVRSAARQLSADLRELGQHLGELADEFESGLEESLRRRKSFNATAARLTAEERAAAGAPPVPQQPGQEEPSDVR